jgi:hypothetical protein
MLLYGFPGKLVSELSPHFHAVGVDLQSIPVGREFIGFRIKVGLAALFGVL